MCIVSEIKTSYAIAASYTTQPLAVVIYKVRGRLRLVPTFRAFWLATTNPARPTVHIYLLPDPNEFRQVP